MDSVTWIRVAWELREAGKSADYIAGQVAVNRATVYRWLRGVRQWGIHGYVRRYENAKKGHRHRKTSVYVEQRVLAIRQAHHGSCGEKIVYWLEREGISLSRSTVYRILNKHVRLRAKGRRNISRGCLPQAHRPREVVQMDSIDLGGVFAFTAIDIFTREGLVVLRPSLTAKDGAAALRVLNHYWGSCQTIQTDGGSEFQAEFAALTPAVCHHHRIARPYKKNEQAFIERFNLTVRRECLGWHKYEPHHIPFLQRRVDVWLHYYHYLRPCMAFQPMRPPLPSESHLI
jgi:IS30 family transposase